MASLNSHTLKRTLLSVFKDQSRFVCNSCRSRFLYKQTRQLHSSRNTQQEARPENTASKRKKLDKGIEVLKVRDPSQVTAETAEGLEWIGSKRWAERQRDRKDEFKGWSRKPVEIDARNVDAFLKEIQVDAFGQSTPEFDEHAKTRIHESVAKITGVRLSDIKLQGVKTLSGLRIALMKKQKEPKFSEIFGRERAAVLRSLPNVSVIDRRVTMVDKEKERGRWKLIEKALRDRNLPVFKKEATRERQLL